MTIDCTILLFARLADALGQSELTLELTDGATAGDALEAALAEHPDLQAGTAIAVNEQYASREVRLRDGDVVALIPPVSGG